MPKPLKEYFRGFFCSNMKELDPQWLKEKKGYRIARKKTTWSF